MCPEIDRIYGNRVRVRACGICWHENKVLMVNHIGLGSRNFWAPPGGGVEFGESLSETLEREFIEETGLQVVIGRFVGVCELLKRPLHAVELFFEVSIKGGTLTKGIDPELPAGSQMISSVAFMSFEAIRGLDKGEKHGLFEIVKSEKELKTASGYWKI